MMTATAAATSTMVTATAAATATATHTTRTSTHPDKQESTGAAAHTTDHALTRHKEFKSWRREGKTRSKHAGTLVTPQRRTISTSRFLKRGRHSVMSSWVSRVSKPSTNTQRMFSTSDAVSDFCSKSTPNHRPDSVTQWNSKELTAGARKWRRKRDAGQRAASRTHWAVATRRQLTSRAALRTDASGGYVSTWRATGRAKWKGVNGGGAAVCASFASSVGYTVCAAAKHSLTPAGRT